MSTLDTPVPVACARTTERWLSPRALLVLSLAALYLIWSSTYLALRYVVEAAPPLLSAGTRYLAAGLILYVIGVATGAAKPTMKEWLRAIPSAALLFVVGNGFVALAEQDVGSGLAAIACAGMPLFLAVFGAMGGERSSPREWIGLGVGFVGVALLGVADLRASATAGVLLALAPVGWALGSFVTRRMPIAKGAMGPASQMILGGGMAIAAGAARGEAIPARLPSSAIFALVYLVVFGSVVAFSAYAYLLRNARPSVATSYAYVNPILAVLLGVLVGNESLKPTALAATVLVVGGVVLTMRAKAAPKTRADGSRRRS